MRHQVFILEPDMVLFLDKYYVEYEKRIGVKDKFKDFVLTN